MAALLPFRDINVHASSAYYAFTSPSNSTAPNLVIERPSGDIRLNSGQLSGTKRVSSAAGILGIIKLKLDKYVIIITKTKAMGRLRGHMVYRILATEFLPLRERPVHDPDEDTYLAYLKSLLANGPMYFSYTIDLTNAFQRQARADLNQPMWKRADERFFWNRFVQTDLIDFRLGGGSGSGVRGSQQPGADAYILPVMFGMLRITPAKVRNTSFTFALITRRSRHRGGTRYFSRGIDEQGHVSNFNETEQIVILNDTDGSAVGYAGGDAMGGKIAGSTSETQILSYVQTRGSVPVFWAEVNDLHYTPKLQIRGVDSAQNAARRHFTEQIRTYGDNYLVNLVNQRGREERVKKAYEQMVRTLVSSSDEAIQASHKTSERFHEIEPQDDQQRMDRLHYEYFDFHNETKGLKWHRAELLLNKLRDNLEKGGYFLGVEMPGDNSGALEVRLTQTAVVRTNCMDCLDRTNVVQSMLGRWALTRQLRDAGVLSAADHVSDDTAFESLYRNIWADNADVVSKSYSGTGALKTDFTRTGNRTRMGMAQDLSNSVTRYVRNNFLDGPRQDGFDVFLGAYLPAAAGAGQARTFVDKRPLLVQAVPYVFAAMLFVIFITLVTSRPSDATVWPLRIFVLLCVAVAGWAGQFIFANGVLYVNWPKLNTPPYVIEGFQNALSRAQKDPILGQLVKSTSARDKRARNLSQMNVGYMEEGKKRIE